MAYTAYKAKKLLNELNHKYLGLLLDNTEPKPTELSGNGYSRLYLELGDATDEKTITNNITLYFPEATDSWGTPTHFGIYETDIIEVPIIIGTLSIEGGAITANTVPLFRPTKINFSFN